MILIDDMGWKDLQCYGSSFYETPCIDRLMSEGMHFTDAYASCPVCSPTRASIMTGKYPATVGMTNFLVGRERGKLLEVPYIHYLPFTERTLPSVLRREGYSTWHIGKWHLGDEPYYPENHGFDVNIGGCSWGHQKSYFSPYGNPRMTDGADGEYLNDRLTDEAIMQIRNRGSKPFFLNLCHYAVHIPLEAPEPDIEYFTQKAHVLGLDSLSPFEEGEFFPCEHKRDQRVIRRRFQSDPVYAALIRNLDHNVGRLLDVIDEEGESANTMVIFTSDNGGLSTAEGSPTCNYPLSEGKGWMYEGGTRVPLIIRWNGTIAAGTVCHEPVTSPDFYPTFLEAAGLPLIPEQHVDGVSLMSCLQGKSSCCERSLFWHYPHYGNQGGTPASAIRRGNYKLIEFFEDSRLELYNLKEDVSETHNLSSELPDRTEEMHRELTAWRERVEAQIPNANPHYIPPNPESALD
jgi:arylsulfatase A-like enzyme